VCAASQLRLAAPPPHAQEYKDSNHKPEMALALEDFEALCGFVAPTELAAALCDTPELRRCVGEVAAQAVLDAGDLGSKEVSGRPCWGGGVPH
jgi:hypothetical protein